MSRQNDKTSNNTAVSEFLVSATPWVTSSTTSGIKEHTFTDSLVSSDPSWVASWFNVTNTSTGSLKLGFSSLGISNTNHFITINPGEQIQVPLRVKSIFVSGSAAQPYQILAGITNLKAELMPTLTSSNGYPGIG